MPLVVDRQIGRVHRFVPRPRNLVIDVSEQTQGHEIGDERDQLCFSDVHGHESAIRLIVGEVSELEVDLLALYYLRNRHFFSNNRQFDP
jgi:hypothetical protein